MGVDKKKLKDLYESIVLSEAGVWKIYVKNKSEVPQGRKLLKGPKGGLYYMGSRTEKEKHEQKQKPVKNEPSEKMEFEGYGNVIPGREIQSTLEDLIDQAYYRSREHGEDLFKNNFHLRYTKKNVQTFFQYMNTPEGRKRLFPIANKYHKEQTGEERLSKEEFNDMYFDNENGFFGKTALQKELQKV